MSRVVLIAAVARGGAIGRGNALPWHLPEDLQHFKRTTLGCPVVMGRRTWDSIGRPLPGRRSLVVSRQPGLAIEGVEVFESLDAALQAAATAPETCVIGGAEIYRQALPRAGVVHLTRVHASVQADTFFPALDAAEWEEVAREDCPADDRHAHPYSFLTLRRVSRPASG
jgi:dihydrofolate reductase